MVSRAELHQLYGNKAQQQPITHQSQDWPYDVPHDKYVAYTHVPHDIGGTPAAPAPFEDKEEELWELNTYITCEVLGWRGVWNAEERRRRADNDVGAALYYALPYYGRWIWAAARMLVDKNHISLIELMEKIAEVKARAGAAAGVHREAAADKPGGGGTETTAAGKEAHAAKSQTTAPVARRVDIDTAPVRFKEGDRVRVKDAPTLFYSRTQIWVRGVTGTIAHSVYQDLAPEDEAWNRDDALRQQFYIVRFRQKDLWPEYPFDNDTLQTELPDGWLEAVR
jgi:thiocyanate hydrolase subunit beta